MIGNVGKLKNRKLVGEVDSVRKTSFAYCTEKFGLKDHATSHPSFVKKLVGWWRVSEFAQPWESVK
jgi:hypothetical protein